MPVIPHSECWGRGITLGSRLAGATERKEILFKNKRKRSSLPAEEFLSEWVSLFSRPHLQYKWAWLSCPSFAAFLCLLLWQLRLVGTSATSLTRACSAIFGKAGVFAAAFPIWIIAGADAKLLGPCFLHRGTWRGCLRLPARAQQRGSFPLSGSQDRSPPPSPKDSFSFRRIDGLLACVSVLITQYHFFLVHSVCFQLHIQLVFYFWKVFLSCISKLCFFLRFWGSAVRAGRSVLCSSVTVPVRSSVSTKTFSLTVLFSHPVFPFPLLLCCVLSVAVYLRGNYFIKCFENARHVFGRFHPLHWSLFPRKHSPPVLPCASSSF